MIRCAVLALLFVVVSGSSARCAQPAPREIHGRIKDPSGTGIADAIVEVADPRAAGSITAVTSADGSFRLRLTSEGGRLLLTAHRVGFAPVSLVVMLDSRARDWVITMRPLSYSLAPAVTTEKRTHTLGPRRDMASSGSATNSSIALGLPSQPGDLAELAQRLNPAVIGVAGPDGLSTGLSIGGQPPGYTGITLDGATTDALSMPDEAISSVRAFISTYDVSRGQFASGQVAATTRSGTETWQGAASVKGSAPIFASSATGRASSVRWDPRRVTLSGGGGGPIVSQWLYAYGAVDVGYSEARPFQLSDPMATPWAQLAVHADSVKRFLEITDRVGLAPLLRTNGAIRSKSVDAILRLDSPLTAAQTLTARFDLSMRSTGVGSFRSLSGISGERQRTAGGALLELTTVQGDVDNQARLSLRTRDSREIDRFAFPRVETLVTSQSADSTSVGMVSVGGTGPPFPPSAGHEAEVSNDFAWTPQQQGWRLIAGFAARVESAESSAATDLGVFEFASLANLETGRPSRFVRNLGGAQGSSAQSRFGAVYLGVAARGASKFGSSVGLRAEVRSYPTTVPTSPSVRTIAGRTVSDIPSDFSLSPRAGFRYAPNPRLSVFGGSGLFVAPVRATAIASPLSSAGGTAEQYLACVGPAVPVPDWPAFRANPSNVPTACVGDTSDFAARARPATIFGPSYRSPRVWRSSVGGQIALGIMSLSFESAIAVSNTEPLANDRNFVAADSFVLPGEAARPVFTSLDQIDTATARIAPTASRLDPVLGIVREIRSTGLSRVIQHTLQLSGVVPFTGATFFSLGYAFTDAVIESSGLAAPGGYSVPTPNSPNERSVSASPFAPRHSIVIALTYPRATGWLLTIVASLRSGAPFTPLVAEDVNADGLVNDRAFVIDPAAAPDVAVANGMRSLMATSPASRCLRAQLGRIADAGTCTGPWWRSVNAAATYTPRGRRALSFTLSAQNVLAGVDRMWHGFGGTAGWGEVGIADDRLLFPVGFDRASQRFKYVVNPGFGSLRRDLMSSSPFRLELRARLAVGGDPARPGVATGVPAPPVAGRLQELEGVLRTAIINVPEHVLQLHAQRALDLTTSQVIRLHLVMDSLRARIEPSIAAISSSILDATDGQPTEIDRTRRRALIREAQAAIDAGVQAVREILGPDAWNELPESLRSPSRTIPETMVFRGRIRGAS